MKCTKKQLLLVFCLLFTLSVNAQSGPNPVSSSDSLATKTVKLPTLSSVLLGDIQELNDPLHTKNLITRPKTFHPAFFCRMEDHFASKNKVNLKMRLGSVDYVDYLESKPGSQLKSINQP